MMHSDRTGLLISRQSELSDLSISSQDLQVAFQAAPPLRHADTISRTC